MLTYHLRVVLWASIFVLCQVTAAATTPLDALQNQPFEGQRVRGVLDQFEAAGFEFVYSRRVVRRHMRVTPEINSGAPLERLRSLLARFHLQLQPGRQSNRWLIVVAPKQSAPPTAQVTKSRQARMPLIEEVIVTSSRYSLKSAKDPNAPSHQLRDNELSKLPEVGDDALRAALHLPGMATVGLSAQPHVRGGLKDETLILFDGVELLEPFHLKDFQSLFSGVNPSLVQSIDVYTGGFPARYGDRLSSVIDIKPLTNHTEVGGELNLSLLTAGLSLHGPMRDGAGDWVVSGRRGNLDLVTKLINPDVGKPRYSDYFAQFSTELSLASELSGTLIHYDDDVRLQDGEVSEEDGERAFSRYRNSYGWLKYGKTWNDAISTTSVLSYGRIRHKRTGEVVDDDPDDSNAFASDTRNFDLYSLQQQLSYISSASTRLELGARFNFQRGSYDYAANVLRGDLAEFVGSEPETTRQLSLKPSGSSGGLYGSLQSELSQILTSEIGLRWDYQDYAGAWDDQISPRFSLRAELGERTSLRLSLGRFYQPEALHELQIVDGFDVYQRAQRADHYIAGLSHNFGDSGFRLRMEAFHKRIKRPKRRFENLFNPLVLLPELAADRVSIAPTKARARGLEISLGHRSRHTSTWLSYSRSKAEDLIDNVWTARSWDQRNTVSAGTFVERNNWTLSATLLWHSGWPTTPLPAQLNEELAYDIQRNSTRLPHFLSMDLKLARAWQRNDHHFTLFAEITNLLDRNNIGSIEIDLEESEDEESFTVTREPVTVLPLIPSIGFTWSF